MGWVVYMSTGLLGLIVTVVILILDAVISIWNSYTAGQAASVNRKLGILFYVLGGLMPMTYVMSIVITELLAYFKIITQAIVSLLLNFDFIVFGAVIIAWGVIATATSIIVAVRTRDWKAALISAYNIGALVYDVWDYLSNIISAIGDFASDLAGGGDDDEDSGLLFLIIITAIALVIGFIITYAAYRAGRESV
jgi:hypothetical protein